MSVAVIQKVFLLLLICAVVASITEAEFYACADDVKRGKSCIKISLPDAPNSTVTKASCGNVTELLSCLKTVCKEIHPVALPRFKEILLDDEKETCDLKKFGDGDGDGGGGGDGNGNGNGDGGGGGGGGKKLQSSIMVLLTTISLIYCI